MRFLFRFSVKSVDYALPVTSSANYLFTENYGRAVPCESLPWSLSSALGKVLERAAQALRHRSQSFHRGHGHLVIGHDFVIV